MLYSEYKRLADELQASMRPAMAEHGFRRRGRTFHCSTADGLTQVVHLQMGPRDPPGALPIPGFRESHYGKVTVNLGVFIPEVAEARKHRPRRTIQEHHCSVRARLGVLTPARRDVWWQLASGRTAQREVMQALVGWGLPWLDRLSARDDILDAFNGLEDPPWAATEPPRILCAIVLAHQGRSDEARALLRAQATNTRNPRHPEYVRKLAERLGLGPLEP